MNPGIIDDIEILDDFEMEAFDKTSDLEPIVFESNKNKFDTSIYEVESPVMESTVNKDFTGAFDFAFKAEEISANDAPKTEIPEFTPIKTLEEEFREISALKGEDEMDALTERTMSLLNTAELLSPKITTAPIIEDELEEEFEPEAHGNKGAILVGTMFAILIAFLVALPQISSILK